MRFFTIVMALLVLQAYAYAETLLDKAKRDYPAGDYIVGIGEAESTGNRLVDQRISDVLARREIASQIRVRLREESLDVMCEGGPSTLFEGKEGCRDLVVMVVEASVDEFLSGASIVERGEREGRSFSIAVMPRAAASETLQHGIEDSIDRARQGLMKAGEGDGESLARAREEYVRARTYDKQKEIIDGVRSRSAGVFEELERELGKLR